MLSASLPFTLVFIQVPWVFLSDASASLLGASGFHFHSCYCAGQAWKTCVYSNFSHISLLTSYRKCCAFYSILNDPWEILRYIYQPIYLYTPMACMNCFLNVLFHYHRIVQHTIIILSLFHFLDCSIISLSSDVHLLSAYLVTCYFWCRFSTWSLKASFLSEAFFLKVFIFLIGGSGRENFEDRFDGGRKVGFPVWGWYDEKVRPQKHRQTFGGLHPKWTYLYCDGIHALWRSQNISTGKVTNIIRDFITFTFHLVFAHVARL